MKTGHEDLAGLARTKDQADRNIVNTFTQIRFLAWAIYGFAGALCGIAVWITTVQITLSQHSKEITINSAARETNKLTQQQLEQAIAANAAAVSRNEGSIKALQQKVYGFVP